MANGWTIFHSVSSLDFKTNAKTAAQIGNPRMKLSKRYPNQPMTVFPVGIRRRPCAAIFPSNKQQNKPPIKGGGSSYRKNVFKKTVNDISPSVL